MMNTNTSDSVPSSEGNPSPPDNGNKSKPSTNNKRKSQNQNGKPNKRFKRQDNNQPGYQQVSTPKLGYLPPLLTFFNIYTSNCGLSNFCDIIYAMLTARDYKIQSVIAESTLRYVSHIAFIYRLLSIAFTHGTRIKRPTFYSDLESVSRMLTLPEPIARCIECLGLVKSTHGLSILPYSPTAKDLCSVKYANLSNILSDAGIECDRLTEESDEAYLTRVLIDEQKIVNYVQATGRGYKANILFRTVEYATTEGKDELLVGYKEETGSRRIPGTFVRLDNEVAFAGASYGFRDYNKFDLWPGETSPFHLSFEGAAFHPAVFVTSHFKDMINK